MKSTQIGLSREFPHCIRNWETYCSTLCSYGVWDRSPRTEKVKAFRTKEIAESYIKRKGIHGYAVIPYKELEE